MQWKHGVLTTGPPGKHSDNFFIVINFKSLRHCGPKCTIPKWSHFKIILYCGLKIFVLERYNTVYMHIWDAAMHEMISIFQAPKEERENHIKHIKDRKETQPFQSSFSFIYSHSIVFSPINTGMSPNILSNQNLSNTPYLVVV